MEERQHRPAELFPDPTPAERQRMIARHRQQLRELLSDYGKIDMVCLDINFDESVWPQLKETIKQLRKIQPDVMFRNRGIGNYGDYYTPERVVPDDQSGNPMPWMVIYPLGTNFSIERDPNKHKGAKWVVQNLVDTVAKGGNFMVGIGPDETGRFNSTAVAQLEQVGAWLKINGAAIFDTHERFGNHWKDGESVRYTASDDGKYLYAISLVRPGKSLELHSVQPLKGSRIELLGYDGVLKWQSSTNGIEIEFPDDVANALAYALRIETQ